VAVYTGPQLGGFLNATFGNATELIICIFAIKEGLPDVVKASLAGSVLGNSLLVLGASFFFGGLKFKIQKFNRNAIEVSTSLLLFAAIGVSLTSLISMGHNDAEMTTTYEWLSIAVAAGMFIIYILGLIFSYHTHKDIYGVEHEEVAEGTNWSLKKSIIILFVATLFIALESEFLVKSIEHVTDTMPISQFFIGMILVPIIGNAAEHSTAILMAMKNKMDIAVEIAIGSSLQIVLFVLPVTAFVSLLFTPMSMVLNIYEVATLIASSLVVNKIVLDGESNWLEGALLIMIYLIIAACFLMV